LSLLSESNVATPLDPVTILLELQESTVTGEETDTMSPAYLDAAEQHTKKANPWRWDSAFHHSQNQLVYPVVPAADASVLFRYQT